MRPSFHPEALEEYMQASSFYADISHELAEAFIESIETGIEQILENPEAWQIVKEDMRRHLVNRFPFGIYYCIEEETILIYAVMHMSREPEYWTRRTRETDEG